jgi:hypothetical protein
VRSRHASLLELQEAIREADQLWDIEQSDPVAMRARLRQQFLRPVIGFWAFGGALVAAGLALNVLFLEGWIRYLPFAMASYGFFLTLNAMLLLLLGVIALWTLVRYRDYRFAVKATQVAPGSAAPPH